jgi:hypothetical protein
LNDATITQRLLFPDLFDRPLVAQFDQRASSVDTGALLLKAADRRLGLTEALSDCLEDSRQPGKVRHELQDLLAQRVFGIACGYPDANDADRLADDPVHKLLLDRDPLDGFPLASQPTLSRFENAVTTKDLYRMGSCLLDRVIERHRKRLRRKVRRITLDFDPTDDPTHGAQQLSFFNGHYDCWCYLPLLGFVTFNDEAEQYLLAALLRPGNASAKLGFLPLLWRMLERLTLAFPKARILVRLDGGFASPEVLDFLDDADVDYVVAMAKNPVLTDYVEPWMKQARRASERSGETEHVYGELSYATTTWSHKRRVIFKAEVVRHPGREPKDNPRFVVTNLRLQPRRLYERVYCDRGDAENRIKELHHGLEIDRTSCERFWANQFRVLLTAAAYLLMQEIRLAAKRTALARAQVSTLREHLFKIGGHVVRSVRRFVFHLPAAFAHRDAWARIALALGARPG